MKTTNLKVQEVFKKSTVTDYPLEKDVSTIDGLMKAFYEVVSGDAGERRQWERDLSIHDPKAVYSYSDIVDGELQQVTMSLSEFHKRTDIMTLESPFYENEIYREVRLFGNIAQVWSTYETRLEKDGKVERRGINSLQLVFDKGRWSIVSLIFERERVEEIPRTFEPN